MKGLMRTEKEPPMDAAAILHELTHAEGLQKEALRAASERRAEMTPLFLDEIEKYLAASSGERRLLFSSFSISFHVPLRDDVMGRHNRGVFHLVRLLGRIQGRQRAVAKRLGSEGAAGGHERALCQ